MIFYKVDWRVLFFLMDFPEGKSTDMQDGGNQTTLGLFRYGNT